MLILFKEAIRQSKELQIPIIYDIDCGHVPPQITLINGSYAEVKSDKDKGTVFKIDYVRLTGRLVEGY